MGVELEAEVLAQYRAFSLFNSPYHAHERGRAIDLYPGQSTIPSPVAGTVQTCREVSAPTKSYAQGRDWVVIIDTGGGFARLLHLEPSVEPGDSVGLGDPLGTVVRSGYLAPWVPAHLHLEFRDPSTEPLRARGGRPIEPAGAIEAVPWDGTGQVVEVGTRYLRLDAPANPASGSEFAGLALDDGAVLDGGLPHYGCGLIGDAVGEVSILGTNIGVVAGERSDSVGEITALPVELHANGSPISGLSLRVVRTGSLGATLIDPPAHLDLGDFVQVTAERTM